MSVRPKPFKTHRPEPAIKAVVTAPVDRSVVTQRAYHVLVTAHNVPPDRARELLGLPQK